MLPGAELTEPDFEVLATALALVIFIYSPRPTDLQSYTQLAAVQAQIE